MQPAAALILAAQELARSRAPSERRRGLTALLHAAGEVSAGDAPAPLEPLGDLLAPIAAALDADTLAALPTADVDVARGLFELAHALPSGPGRELARGFVERRMLEGPCAMFVALARQKALAAPHELRGDPVRARLGLALAGRPAPDVGVAKLALALVSRRDGCHTWLELPSVRSLSERRMSARLLGRIARGLAASGARLASLRHHDEVEIVLRRLLADREPLVWRHAAVARGLLAEVHSPARREIEAALAPSATATEWRRGAASLAASIGHEPGWALATLERAIADGLLSRDAGVATAFTWGVAAGAERDPSAADRALTRVAELAPLAVAEGLASALALGPGGGFGADATARVRDELVRARASSGQARGVGALLTQLIGELGPEASPVVAAVERAVAAYHARGAREASDASDLALGLLTGGPALAALIDGSSSLDDEAALLPLRELERSVLEDGTLHDLHSLRDGGARATQLS